MRPRRERLVDAAVAAGVLVLGLPGGADGIDGIAGIAGIAVTLAIALLLLARRSSTRVVLAAVAVLTTVQFPFDLPSTSVAGLLVAIWTVADREDRTVSLASAAAGSLPVVLSATATAGDGRFRTLVLVLSLVCSAWALGAYRRAGRQVVEGLHERADRLERERHAQAEVAVTGERLRVMREMHDVLGHSLSVIAVQADAARAVLPTDPARSQAAMGDVAAVARQALAEMRGIVRDGRSAPVPDLGALAGLVDAARRAGTDVDLTVTGDLDVVSAGPSAAGYRVVQEALTNVRRHAGPGAVATVQVTAGPDGLHVVVRNAPGPATTLPEYPRRTLPGSASTTAGGTGLLAMAERVDSFGGSLRHGWAADGSFRVSARIPLRADAARP